MSDILLRIAEEVKILQQQKSDLLAEYADKTKSAEAILLDLNNKISAAKKELSYLEAKKSDIPALLNQSERKAKELIDDANAKAVDIIKDAIKQSEEMTKNADAYFDVAKKQRAEAENLSSKAKKELEASVIIRQEADKVKIGLESVMKTANADKENALKLKSEHEAIKVNVDALMSSALKENELLSKKIVEIGSMKSDIEKRISDVNAKEKLLSEKEIELSSGFSKLNEEKEKFESECKKIRSSLEKQAEANDFEKKLIESMKTRIEDDEKHIKVELRKIEEIKKNLK